MTIADQRRRLADLAGALRLARALAEREHAPRAQLRRHQQQQLDAIVRHAVAHSRFHRERLADLVGDGPVDLARLPTMDKAEMMDRFDDVVCDPRLRRDELLAHVERAEHPEPYLGAYRVMTTSGSSGRKGLFVYGPAAWRVILAQFLRYNAMIGLRPRLPRRLRVAAIGGGSATHMTSQISASVSVGVHRILALPATMPLERLVAELNRFRPDVVNVYPSVATGLVEEQLEGRLRIAPSILSTSSELRTPELTARLSEAFGVTPFDLYATTEGLWGCECEHHRGVHLFEDTVLVENVDAEGRVVAPGEPGARLLITSLSNRTQPLIRLELPDVLTLDPEPCPCGRSLVRTRSLDGRSDDVLELPARDGGTVRVLPIEFAVVTRDRDVREFQVVQEGARLRVLVVAREGAGAALEARVGQALSERLAALGTAGAGVTVERRGELPRSPGGKLQLVVADRRAAAGTVSPASA